MVKSKPIVHIRTVFTGNERSLMGWMTARTSGKGESSASYDRTRSASRSRRTEILSSWCLQEESYYHAMAKLYEQIGSIWGQTAVKFRVRGP
jgi:hypothetical protein